MINPELKHGRFFEEYFPFTLRALNQATAVKDPGGEIYYTIDLNQSQVISARVVGEQVVGNPLLDLFRLGKNPAADFLSDRLAYLSDRALPGETVALADSDHPMRWSSAGGMMIFEDSLGNHLTPLNFRTRKGFYGHRLGDFAGMSNRIADWLVPEILCHREITEELIIVHDGKLVFPANRWFHPLELQRLMDHQSHIAGHIT